jgi:Flp pilus assembly CpaF family ATPase
MKSLDEYLETIRYYRKALLTYENLLKNATLDDDLEISLRESVDACFQGIEEATTLYQKRLEQPAYIN